MNLNDRRVQLADKVRELAPLWYATTQSWPDWAGTYTAQVGHVGPNPDNFRGQRAELPLRLWVNEGNDTTGAHNLYAAISGDEGSLVQGLRAVPWVKGVTVDGVDMVQVGPTWFTVADLTVTVRLNQE